MGALMLTELNFAGHQFLTKFSYDARGKSLKGPTRTFWSYNYNFLMLFLLNVHYLFYSNYVLKTDLCVIKTMETKFC